MRDTRPGKSERTPRTRSRIDWRGSRGAVLVHVALMLIALMGLSALVIDYGVLWAARRQAQNAADAGAMAGAVSMAFVDMNDQPLARTSAINTARQNRVWGDEPDIVETDVTFPLCPPGSPGAGVATCIRVNVFRNQRADGNPLPTIFANLFGVSEQGVRATATAVVLRGARSDCVKPFAIPDKWLEMQDPDWDELDSFQRYVQNGQDKGAMMNPADVFVPPGQSDPGTGFTTKRRNEGGDYGRRLNLKAGNPSQSINPGWFFPVIINPTEGPGGDIYRENIATCDPTVIGPGTVLQNEPGNMIGPTFQGMQALYDQDPNAMWSDSANGGAGGIVGGCMQAGTCMSSPRLVAIPLFDPDAYDKGRASGRLEITVTKVLGFFIEEIQSNNVYGRLMTIPTMARAGDDIVPEAAFVISIALVR